MHLQLSFCCNGRHHKILLPASSARQVMDLRARSYKQKLGGSPCRIAVPNKAAYRVDCAFLDHPDERRAHCYLQRRGGLQVAVDIACPLGQPLPFWHPVYGDYQLFGIGRSEQGKRQHKIEKAKRFLLTLSPLFLLQPIAAICFNGRDVFFVKPSPGFDVIAVVILLLLRFRISPCLHYAFDSPPNAVPGLP